MPQLSILGRAQAMMNIAAILGQQVSNQSLPVLFEQLVTRLVEDLGYYHVHVYLLQRKTLSLAFGYGDAGRQMMAAGHNIRIEQGLVGAAARSKEPALVDDVTQSEDWLPNPLLPETKAELAVPILAGEQVLGVLDVQSRQAGGLSGEDRDLLLGLCGMIAVVIQNARLVERMQRQIDEHGQLAAMVRELSAPAIQVWRGVLVLPLVGTIGSERAMRIMEELLAGIARHQAEQVIIDVTGVPVFDSEIASHLVQTIKAATLLGAECMLVGINSDMAQTIVGLGLDLTSIVTYGNLHMGLQAALGKLGYAIKQVERQDV